MQDSCQRGHTHRSDRVSSIPPQEGTLLPSACTTPGSPLVPSLLCRGRTPLCLRGFLSIAPHPDPMGAENELAHRRKSFLVDIS